MKDEVVYCATAAAINKHQRQGEARKRAKRYPQSPIHPRLPPAPRRPCPPRAEGGSGRRQVRGDTRRPWSRRTVEARRGGRGRGRGPEGGEGGVKLIWPVSAALCLSVSLEGEEGGGVEASACVFPSSPLRQRAPHQADDARTVEGGDPDLPLRRLTTCPPPPCPLAQGPHDPSGPGPRPARADDARRDEDPKLPLPLPPTPPSTTPSGAGRPESSSLCHPHPLGLPLPP